MENTDWKGGNKAEREKKEKGHCSCKNTKHVKIALP